MGWIHDTGYDPAYAHEGWAAAVLDDGTDTACWTRATGARVTGWRAACECGWRGAQFYPRAEWPTASGRAPEQVEGMREDGSELGGGCLAEWLEHLHAALPALAVHDLTQTISRAQAELGDAVARARDAGASWTTIGAAAGITRQSAHERWGLA